VYCYLTTNPNQTLACFKSREYVRVGQDMGAGQA